MKKPIKLVHPGMHRDVTGSISDAPEFTVVYIDEPFYEMSTTTIDHAERARDIASDDVMEELVRAMEKHQEWPADLLHQFAIVQEEIGETQKEILQFVYETSEDLILEKHEAIRKEAIQATATLLRFIAHLDL